MELVARRSGEPTVLSPAMGSAEGMAAEMCRPRAAQVWDTEIDRDAFASWTPDASWASEFQHAEDEMDSVIVEPRPVRRRCFSPRPRPGEPTERGTNLERKTRDTSGVAPGDAGADVEGAKPSVGLGLRLRSRLMGDSTAPTPRTTASSSGLWSRQISDSTAPIPRTTPSSTGSARRTSTVGATVRSRLAGTMDSRAEVVHHFRTPMAPSTPKPARMFVHPRRELRRPQSTGAARAL